MEVKTKYDVNDTVWIVDSQRVNKQPVDRATKGIIKRIEVVYSIVNIHRNTPPIIYYYVDCYAGCDYLLREEHKVFATCKEAKEKAKEAINKEKIKKIKQHF